MCHCRSLCIEELSVVIHMHVLQAVLKRLYVQSCFNGCQILSSPILKEWHGVRMFENRVPWRIFVAVRERLSGGCRLLHNVCANPGRTACCPAPDCWPPATKALHTIRGNNTSVVSSSWWWAYKCPKHVEQIIIAINHSVASSWFFSLFG